MRTAIIRLAAALSLLICLAAIGCGNDGNSATAARAAPPALATRAPAAPAASPPPVSPTSSPTATPSPVPPAPQAFATPAAIMPTVGNLTPAPDAPMTAADFPAPPERNLPLLAQQLRWRGPMPTPTPGPPATRPTSIGGATDFWVLDYPRRQMTRRHFRLAGVSEHAYWWVEDGLKVADADLQRAIDEAETRIYPRLTAAFGGIPEIDAGGRGHIVTARIPGLGGYVSGADPYPASVNPYSNQAAAIYINGAIVPPGSAGFDSILAHELQHAIHWQADNSEEGWLNEGLAELAITEAGYDVGSIDHYLEQTDAASLVNWPASLDGDVGRSYGAAALFAHYLREHYAAGDGLRRLLAIDADGIAGLDAYLSRQAARDAAGQPANFQAVFADWIAANLLDLDSGKHGYSDLDIAAATTRRQRVDDTPETRSLPQYAVDYVEIDRDGNDAVTIHFAGDDTAPLFPDAIPGGSCWWSNRGDSISSTLTRQISVPPSPDSSNANAAGNAAPPALSFRYWHDIETDWDYLYVMASTDNGATWDALPAANTTDSNPLGNAYGPGYTGNSYGWQDAAASLAAYAGRDILARFHYVTDDAIHAPGFCVRDLRITGDDNDDDGNSDGEWRPDGFVLVNNQVRQNWIVWVIDYPATGGQPTAARMTLRHHEDGGQYAGALSVPASADGDSDGRLIVAVSPIAPATMQTGQYRLWAKSGVN